MSFLEIVGYLATWGVVTMAISSVLFYAVSLAYRRYEIGAYIVAGKIALVFIFISAAVALIQLGRMIG